MAMNLHNERKHVYLAMLVTAAALICVFTTSFARATEPQSIIVADIFGDLQQRLEKGARDVINNSAASDTRRLEQSAADQTVPPSQYPEQAMPTTTQPKKEKKLAKGAGASQVPSLPFVEWYGTWRSQDGKNSLALSSSKMVSTFLVKEDNGKFRKVTVEARWSNLTASNEEETFGLSKKNITPTEIAKRYEKALQYHKKNPTDFGVSDPQLSRKAISAMSHGSYQVMWSYFGGESGSEYIVDKDRILEVKDDPYGFTVTLYDRIK